MEIMLVLAILVAMGAVAMPLISGMMRGNKLRAASDQVRAAWGKARNLAMEQAKPYLFRFQPETGSYVVQPWSGADAEAVASTERATSSDAEPTMSADGANNSAEKSLPDNIVFHSGDTSTDTRSQSVLSTDDSNRGGNFGSVAPILFFEDGSTSDARVILINDRQQVIVMELRGLNGTAKVSEIKSISEVSQ